MPLKPIFDAMANPSRNRMKLFVVSPELLISIGRGIYEVIEDPLPRDAAIADIGIDPSTGNVQIKVLSESFPIIEETQRLPEIAPKIQRYVPPESPKWTPREFF
jgi:predicted metal-dependent RNase